MHALCEGGEKIEIKSKSYLFLSSVWEIFMSLFNGAELHILSKDTISDYERFEDYLSNNNITIANLPPMYVNNLNHDRVKSLRILLTAGSVIDKKLLNMWSNKLDYINGYGPTETTVCTTLWKYESSVEKLASVPIGKPINNLSVYIINKNKELLPIGVAGELCVSGDSLALGYLNKEELTNEKFIDNPFIKGIKMYKTGDLVKWLPDGNIEYIGRIDNQVKIRGFRIELGEIESALNKCYEIKESSVIARKDANGELKLIAYLVFNKGESETQLSNIKAQIKNKLPGYMMPSYYVKLDKMPLTVNGKIDTKNLPEVDYANLIQQEYIAPSNETETALAQIWQKVLGVKNIGIMDDFFDLGGHSLKAGVVVSEIRRKFEREINVKNLFNNSNIKSLARFIEKQDKKKYEEIQICKEKKYYKASSAEARMYISWQLNKDSLEYNLPIMIEMEENIDKNKIEAALNKLISRHESLRTSFEIIDGVVVQKILDNWNLDFKYKELNNENLKSEIENFIKPFDLNKAPLLRSELVKLGERDYKLIVDFHHIAVDGVSSSIIMSELENYYEGGKLEELKIQYKDYSEWQNSKEQQEALKIQEQYWLKKFEDDVPVLELITDYERPKIRMVEGHRINFNVNENLTAMLRKLAKETGTTLYMVLLSAFNVLLSKYSGQEDIVIGTVEAGREKAELKNLVGMFVNTVVIRNYPKSSKAYREFLEEVKNNIISDFENKEYQYQNLIEKLNIKRDASRNPMFDVMFVVENMELNNKYKITELKLDIAKFDLNLIATEVDNTINFNLEYSVNLFKKDTIERMVTSYVNILTCVAERSDVKLSEIDMLSKEEKNKVIYEFNATNRAYESGKTIQELFEEQVVKTPENIVVGYENSNLTYKQLNESSNSLARVLREKGISSESIVGIMMERSVDMLVGIMGILKSGGAYLPIDPEYPEDRIKYMLTDSNAKLLLTQTKLMEKVDFSGETINLDDKELYGRDNSNLDKVCCEENLAYVIYTSGTTGNPKGVMVEHKALVNLCNWHNDYYEVSEKDKATKYAGFAFDASVWEIFPYLIKGAAIEIIPKDIMLDVERLHEYYNEKGITISFLPTQVCEQFINFESKSLRVLLTGADKLKTYKETNYKLVNNYGPTENTVVSTSFIVDKQYKNIPIGKPIHNTSVYILSKDGETAPIGVPGELCVAGDNLARGYINREELTREKFVDNPFEPGKKMYKTGDLARWLADGNIEYLGRIDNQVKIRGYRIEIGEIESQMLKIPAIKEAVVVARTDDNGNSYLCSYVTAEEEIAASTIKEELANELPMYMIPSYICTLDKLPITTNGKVDKKALPDIENCGLIQENYESPRDKVEEILVDIWQTVLGVKKVGINSNYYELGGDSIKSIQIVSRLRQNKLNLEVKDLMKYRTIKELSPRVEDISSDINQEIVEGIVQFTPIQKWFFEQKFLEENHFNQSNIFEKKGSIDEDILRKAFAKIVEHHDALRMIYKKDEEVIQVNRGIESSEDIFTLDVYDLKNDNHYKNTIEQISNRIQESMDLEKGILVKLAIFKTQKEDYLLIAMHHMIIDGVSWRILQEDLENSYLCVQEDREIELPLKTISFKEWAERLNNYANSKEFLKEKKYWKQVEETQIDMLTKDDTTDSISQCEYSEVKLTFSKDETEDILRKTSHAYNTEINDILLCALGITLKEWKGIDNIAVNLEGHGREEILVNTSIDRTIGWFTSMYPVVLDMNNADELSSCIKNTKEMLRRIPNKGVGYSILKYLTSDENKKDIEFKIMPEISFNYLGEFNQDENKGIFTYSDLKRGNENSPLNFMYESININGLTVNKEMQFDFGSNSYGYEEIEILSKKYKENVIKIAEHCKNKKEKENTLSDYGDNDLSLEDLNEILLNN
ncbi:non-ribosomal peptide synthetase [Clostridium zeae]|nr:non-ribosomal peptide synthetase [Clostridium zeae]